MKLKDDTIRGVPVEIHVSPGGTFSIKDEQGNDIVLSNSLDEAIKKARPKLAAQKVRVAVPFFDKAGVRGAATSIHAVNRSVMATIGGTSVQLSSYNHRRVFKSDIPAETLERYLTLVQEIRERSREVSAIEREWEFDILPAVEKAVEAKAAEVVWEESS